MPSHADILRRIDAVSERMDGQDRQRHLFHDTLNARMADLFQLVENVEVKVDRLDERTERVEAKVLRYDLMGARIVGFLGAAGIAITALWWFIHDKVAKLLGADG